MIAIGRRRRLLELELACALLLAAALGAPAAHADAGLFAPNSYVNAPLAPDAPLDPASPSMIAALQLQVQKQLTDPFERDNRPTVNTHSCTTSIYTVPAGQPEVTVAISGDDTGDLGLREQLKSVPIPPGAKADPCSDHFLTIYQPSTDKLWELWLAQNVGGQWRAARGGEIGPQQPGMLGVSQNPGYFTDSPTGFGHSYGATATAIPLLAGLQRIAELQAGAINHSVSFGMEAPAPCWRFPAQRQDRDISSSNPLAPPEGAILRLPASLDVDSLNLPHYDAVLARAVQRYGMVLRDRASTTALYAEEPLPGEADPYSGPHGIFGGYTSQQLMAKFPWSKLQVVAVAPGHSSCQTR